MSERIDLTELRKLAERATPGPWKRVGHYVMAKEGGGLLTDDGWRSLFDGSDDYYEGWAYEEADAEYIAALNPATVPRLLDALEDVLTACDNPCTGPHGGPWTYGYDAALEDIRETITTALGADDE